MVSQMELIVFGVISEIALPLVQCILLVFADYTHCEFVYLAWIACGSLDVE